MLAHAESPARVTMLLDTDIRKGLSEDEARTRLLRDGPNSIAAAAGRAWWQILLGQFRSIVVWLLAVAAAVAWITDSPLEAAAILVVLALNALIGFAIEWQAGRALDALRRRSKLTARVTRDGRDEEVDAKELVAGDLLSLTAGDRVPADSRITESFNLQADESALTGESLPVAKSAEAVDVSTLLADRTSMVYLGTTVRSGRASAVVTATGHRTELGRVGQLISEVASERTPLEKRLALLGERLVYIVLVIAVVVLAAGYFRGDGLWLMLEISISLAVAAVPEGLPAVTTLILAIGVIKMAKRNAIVRRLAAVETLGSTTVICSDKTGTLTENRMAVKEFHAAGGQRFSADEKREMTGVEFRLVRAGVLCNEASIGRMSTDVEKEALGDPTETALLAAANSLGTDVGKLRENAELVRDFPFDPDSKRMVSVRSFEAGTAVAILKGAPAVVLASCDRYLASDGSTARLDEKAKDEFMELNERLAGDALRVLGFAEKTVSPDDPEEPKDGFQFLGFAGLIDPPRVEALPAIASARTAGIRVVMLTGDQLNTAAAIARELELSDGGSAVHASELQGLEGEDLRQIVARAVVFARVSPKDKFEIVKALQESGEVVAVTGDGINDAPALKQADIGVAMGERGTEVAKESADIVLTDDNFATIVKAIEGGRTIYSNIIRFVHMMFSHNLGEVLMIFFSLIAGLPLPLFPLQILWINLVTDVFPALALAVEPATENTMNRPPRAPGSRMLSMPFLLLIGWQGLMLALIALLAYLWALDVYGEGAHSRTIALMALIGVQLGHFFNCRSRVRSVFSKPFSNLWIFAAALAVIGLQVAAVKWGPLAVVLGLTVPNAVDLVVIAASVVLPIVVVEITKVFIRHRLKRTVGGTAAL